MDEELTYFLDRPISNEKLPIILTINGSSCRGWKATGFDNLAAPDESAPYNYARVFVAKRGVEPRADGQNCTDEFLKTYTIDQRVTDHLRALQHLRTHAEWWNRDLYILGWSDGGDIGARLTAYYPSVNRAVLGGMGGGTTMAEQFRDDFMCAETYFKNADDRDACITDLTKNFDQMTKNPTWNRSWSGQENSYRVWASRLYARQTNILKDTQQPILIVHGGLDQDSVPVSSARRLMTDLKENGNTNVFYWEIPDMAHSPRSLSSDRRETIGNAMRDWLLTGEPKIPPHPSD